MIYLDNAATSWPKPPEVLQAMKEYLETIGANPGRSGHALSVDAGRMVFETRVAAADLFGLKDPLAVVFTKNATEALNLAIQGTLRPGDHVVTTNMEHNSVLRPLSAMTQRGIQVTRVVAGPDGRVTTEDVLSAVGRGTRLVVLTHASNVVGTINPIGDIGDALSRRNVLFAVDAAQTAGSIPVDMEAMHIDLLAFTGHKGLYGPQGTGGLCLGPRAVDRVSPLMMGGTGSASHSDVHPEFLPDRLEAGTLNAVGLAGLKAGIDFVNRKGVEALYQHQVHLLRELVQGLRRLGFVRLVGFAEGKRAGIGSNEDSGETSLRAARVGVVSFNVDGRDCSDVATVLEEQAGICCRVGLHCAPAAHQHLGTFPQGTVRLSLGAFNSEQDIEVTLKVLQGLGGK
jgi:cysteine desulfurase family protein